MSQTQQQAFSLVQSLASELSDGDLRLPSLPEVAVRLRNALSTPDFSVDQLARLIGSEPALVGSILTMANSTAFRRSGKETTDLKVAISRIGAGMVQTAATAFALRQLRDSADFKRVEHLLAPEWRRAARTAAACYLVAQMSRVTKPDEALVVGLIHNIGRIYLYSRAPQYPSLFASKDELEELVAGWHANVGKAIVESWNLPEEVSEAVARQDGADTSPVAEADDGDAADPDARAAAEAAARALTMTDVLTLAIAIAAVDNESLPDSLDTLAARPDCARLKLSRDQLAQIAAEREPLRQSLGLG